MQNIEEIQILGKERISVEEIPNILKRFQESAGALFVGGGGSLNANVNVNLLTENILKLLEFAKLGKVKILLMNLLRDHCLNLSNKASQMQTTQTTQTTTINLTIPPVILVGALLPYLGDSSTEIRTCACGCLVDLMLDCYAYHQSVKDIHSMIQMFEAKMVASAFKSKTPKAREMAISFLIKVSEKTPISLKAFVPALVGLLNDSVESIRSASKAAILQLQKICAKGEAFTADVLNELSKQSVRPSIISFLNKEMTGQVSISPVPTIIEDLSPSFAPAAEKPSFSRKTPSPVDVSTKTNSLLVDAAAVKIAATGGSAAPDPTPIQISSISQLHTEVQTFTSLFTDKETEQNWSGRDAGIQRFRGVVRGIDLSPLKKASGLMECVKPVLEPILQTMGSLRSALIMSSCALLTDFALSLGLLLQPSLESSILPAILRLAASSKKLVLKICSALFNTVVGACKAWMVDKCTNLLLESLQSDKRASVRCCCMDGLVVFLGKWSGGTGGTHITDRLEKGLIKGLTDPDLSVRTPSREALYIISTKWPEASSRYVRVWFIHSMHRVLGALEASSLKAVLKFLNERKGSGQESMSITTRNRRKSSIKSIADVAPLQEEEPPKEAGEEKINVKAVDAESVFVMLTRHDANGLFQLSKLLATTGNDKTLFDSFDKIKLASGIKHALLNPLGAAEFWGSVTVSVLKEISLLMDKSSVFDIVSVLVHHAFSPTPPAGIQGILDSYVEMVENNTDTCILLNAVLEQIGTARPITRRKSLVGDGGLVRGYFVSWTARLVQTVQMDESVSRAIMNRFVPLVALVRDEAAVMRDVVGVLSRVFGEVPEIFGKVLETFDFEVGQCVRDVCGILHDDGGDEEGEESSVQEQNVEEVEVGHVLSSPGNCIIPERLVAENMHVVSRDFESPLAKRPFGNTRLDQTDAIGQTPPKHARYESVFEEVVALAALIETRQESLMTTTTRVFRLLKKAKTELRSLPIGTLFRGIAARIKSDVNNVDEIEILLVLVKEVIDAFNASQDGSLTGHESTLFELLFACRSHGDGPVSGGASLALESLLQGGSVTKHVDVILSLVSKWGFTGPAFTLLGGQVEDDVFKPFPIVSAIQSLSVLVDRMNPQDVEQVFDLDLLPILLSVLDLEEIQARKAGYECLLACHALLKEDFWECARSRMSDTQMLMISKMSGSTAVAVAVAVAVAR